MTFGESIKQRRLELKFSLREFCRKFDEDASNWSKLERGALPPPERNERLLEIGRYLGYGDDSTEMRELFDLAAVERGKIPQDLMTDRNFLDCLPVVFRTFRDEPPTEEELMRLADMIKESRKA